MVGEREPSIRSQRTQAVKLESTRAKSVMKVCHGVGYFLANLGAPLEQTRNFGRNRVMLEWRSVLPRLESPEPDVASPETASATLPIWLEPLGLQPRLKAWTMMRR